jgi:hypothetical protein
VPDTVRSSFEGNELAARTFPLVRKGFDPAAVRTFLGEIAAEVRAARQRIADLERQVATPPAPPSLIADEESLVAAVGTETARILQVAHDAAREIVAKAERRAAALVADAEGAFSERTRLAAAEEAEVRAAVRAEVHQLRERAREECRVMVDEAREARRRILADLSERRRTLHLQLEQIRAGKDALAGIVDAVAESVITSVDDVRTRLAGSEEAARLAAASATGRTLIEGAVDDVPLDFPSLPSPTDLDRAEAIEHFDDTLELDSDPASGVAPPMGDADSTAIARDADGGGDPDAGSGAIAAEIDELFERIRAARTAEVDDARARLERPVAPQAPHALETPSVPPTESGGDPETHGAGHAGRADAHVALDVADLDAVDDGDNADGASDSVDASGAPIGIEEFARAEGGEAAALLARRSTLLDSATADLARSLKRALRVEENEIRDAARHLSGDADALSAIVRSSAFARIADESRRPLAEARRAGTTFVTELVGADDPDDDDDDDDPTELAEQLARAIIEPLDARIAGALRERAGDLEPAAAVGVAFRDWRGDRIEVVVGDFATASFAAGALAAAHALGVDLSWVVDDGETHCSDCEDNALAGPLAPGAEFPTGHGAPPSHPGCRCLLAPKVAV